MKKLIALSALILALPLTALAQDDDMYFVPKKKSTVKAATQTYYRGSNRDVDEYNHHRRGALTSQYETLNDSDIISFDGQKGVYPDSTYNDADFAKRWQDYEQAQQGDDSDYRYSRELDRWYGCYNPWFYGPGYYGRWHSPFWYSRYYGYYDPWYYGYGGLYDPWYYGYGYYGWYDPWYYGGYYGWGYPWYGGYGYYGPYGGGGHIGGHGDGGHIGGGDVAHSPGRGWSNRGTGAIGGSMSNRGSNGGNAFNTIARNQATMGTNNTTGRTRIASSRTVGSRAFGSSSTPSYSGGSSRSYSGGSSRSYSGGSSHSSSGGGFSGGGGSRGGGFSGGGGGGGSHGGGRR